MQLLKHLLVVWSGHRLLESSSWCHRGLLDRLQCLLLLCRIYLGRRLFLVFYHEVVGFANIWVETTLLRDCAPVNCVCTIWIHRFRSLVFAIVDGSGVLTHRLLSVVVWSVNIFYRLLLAVLELLPVQRVSEAWMLAQLGSFDVSSHVKESILRTVWALVVAWSTSNNVLLLLFFACLFYQVLLLLFKCFKYRNVCKLRSLVALRVLELIIWKLTPLHLLIVVFGDLLRVLRLNWVESAVVLFL